MKSATSCMILFVANLMAQQPPIRGPLSPVPPIPAELKVALGVTENQVLQLRKLQDERRMAVQPIFEAIGQRELSLREMLKAGGASPAVLGQLLLDIENLRKQARDLESSFDEQALAVLSHEQQEKLKVLQEAMKLQPAIQQAIALGLLKGPMGPPPLFQPIGPMPMGIRR